MSDCFPKCPDLSNSPQTVQDIGMSALIHNPSLQPETGSLLLLMTSQGDDHPVTCLTQACMRLCHFNKATAIIISQRHHAAIPIHYACTHSKAQMHDACSYSKTKYMYILHVKIYQAMFISGNSSNSITRCFDFTTHYS